jgi:hypothetical protein
MAIYLVSGRSWKESDSRRGRSRSDINAREMEGVVLKVVDCPSHPRITTRRFLWADLRRR